jgi:hypothetical protein
MITKFNSWEKGLFSVVGVPGGPTTTETTYWYRRDEPGKNPDSIYKDTDIIYKWNKYGFRSDEFVDDGRDCIIALGCSYTTGLGVPVKETWPSLLRDKINPNMKIYNMSLAATSGDYIVRALYKTIEILQPKAVFVLWPGFASREVAFRKKLIPFKKSALMSDAKNDGNMLGLFQSILTDPSFFMYQHYKNKAFAESLCKANNAGYYDLSLVNEDDIKDGIEKLINNINLVNPSENDLKIIGYEKKLPFARDNAHFGFEWNNYIADLYYKKYQSM